MYSVSKEMSLMSYQIVQPAENQTDFRAGQVVRFTIPRQVGFFDSHLSKLQLQCRTQNANFKYCFSSTQAGVASMFDMVRVSQNGKVISEITEYATLQHFIKTYENSLSTQQLDALTKGTVDYTDRATTIAQAGSNSVLQGQGLNRSGAGGAAAMQQDVKFQLTLDFISLFEVLHAVPVMAMGDILLELRLAQRDTEIMKIVPTTGILLTGVSGLANPVPAATRTFVMTPPFAGFTCLADSPFITGMKLLFQNVGGVDSATNDYAIVSMTQAEDTGIITFTVDKDIVNEAGAQSAVAVKITSGADGAAPSPDGDSAEFVLSKAELLLQVVKPPDQYVQDLARQVETEGLMVDMDDFTTYRSTVLAGIKTQTITIPTTQSRAKAVFSVPRKGNQVPAFLISNADDYKFNGEYSNLKDYRTQIDGEYYPNQPVSLNQMLGGWHWSQEHLRELEKAFDSSGIAFRSVDALKQNFVIGRALSSYGSSTNLTATPINLYLNYNASTGPASPADAKDIVTYVHHSVRVAITPMGIEVMS
jgi:hypothetical protein